MTGNGNTTQYTYDSRKRQLTETLPDGMVRRRIYDNTKNIITEIDGIGKNSFISAESMVY